MRNSRALSLLLAPICAGLVLLSACTATTSGTAVAAISQSSSPSSTSQSTSQPASQSSTSPSSTSQSSTSQSTSSSSSTSSTSQTSTTSSTDGSGENTVDGELFLAGKPSLVATSPDGFLVATNPTGQICVEELFETGIYPDGKFCPITIPADATLVFPVFSPDGKYLAVVVTVQTSTVWLVNVDTQETSVVTAEGLSTDPAAAEQMNLSSAVWDAAGDAFYTMQSTSEATGALDARYVDGSAPQQIRGIPAEVVNSYPQLWSAESGVAIAPNVGTAVGQLWYLDFNTAVTSLVSERAADSETLLLQTISPDGAHALVCRANGTDIGPLERVDLTTGEASEVLDTCVGAVFSPDSASLAVGGVVGSGYWLTIFPLTDDGITFDLELGQDEPATPPVLTWLGDVVTVTRADANAGSTPISIVELSDK